MLYLLSYILLGKYLNDGYSFDNIPASCNAYATNYEQKYVYLP